MRLVILRHGESQCNVDGVVGGNTGCSGLSQLGHVQAKLLAERLAKQYSGKELKLYSSNLPRAIQTAEPAANILKSELNIKENLREIDPGEGDGLSWSEFIERFGVPNIKKYSDRPVAPNGESWNEFLIRSELALNEAANCDYEVVLVFAHGGVIQASLIKFLNLVDSSQYLGFRPDYASITEWEKEDRKWRLIRYNDCAHLEVIS